MGLFSKEEYHPVDALILLHGLDKKLDEGLMMKN